MTDIVDRLRDRAYSTYRPDNLCEEAAKEIVRLREMVKDAASLSPFSIDLDTMTIVTEEDLEDEDNRIYISSQHGCPDK